MTKVLRNLGLPLLLKELIEQAARRRTYIVRVVYVSLFFLACLSLILPEMSNRGTSPLNMLGVGRDIFIYIIAWQFAGLYLFLPALACGVLTVEKERNTLGLLFLTRLGPWTIVVEKLLSRLLPMASLLFCSLPLLAFSISLGGVNFIDIFTGVWFLSLTAFQVCAISVACSSFFRTTTAALLTCYAILFLVTFGLPISDWLVFNYALRDFIREFIVNWYGPQTGNNNYYYIYHEMILFCFFGFAQFIMRVEQRTAFGSDPILTVVMGLPLILSALIPIAAARFFLVRRAFIPPKNLALVVLRWIDKLFHALNNNRITKGIIVLDESRSEPDFSPIAWRETHKRSLGQTAYLIRVFLALEIPALLIIMTTIFRAASDYNGMDGVTSVMTLIVWIVAALLVTVTSAGLIAGERGRQTLDILLAMPITGRKIILDKIAGVRRLTWICAIPLITCICFEAWWRDIGAGRSYSSAQRDYLWWNYLFTALSLVFTYLPLLCWLSLWIGLKTKSPTRATLTALIVIVGWCAIPAIAVFVVWTLWLRPPGYSTLYDSGYLMLMQLSPAGLLFQSEFDALSKFSVTPLLPMIVNVLIYGSICLALRWHVLKHADKLLGRSEPNKQSRQSLPVLNLTQPLSHSPSLVE